MAALHTHFVLLSALQPPAQISSGQHLPLPLLLSPKALQLKTLQDPPEAEGLKQTQSVLLCHCLTMGSVNHFLASKD